MALPLLSINFIGNRNNPLNQICIIVYIVILFLYEETNGAIRSCRGVCCF
jgi:hypothetical protein